MNHRMPCRVLVVLIASLGGCGGDHSSTSISVSATSVTINANAGEPAPAAQTIHVTYQGDQAGVGYAPGVAQATWLAVSVVGQTGSTMDVSLQASDTAIAGTRTTTLRFFTSKEDGSDAKFADVQVTCTLTGSLAGNPEASQPPTSISVSTPAVTFDSEQGAVPPAPQKVHVTFQGADVALRSATPPWLAVSEIARTATTVDYSLRVVDTTTSGTFTTALQFFVRSANGSQTEFVEVVVTSTVFGPFGVTAPSLTFSALGGAAQPADPAAGYVVTIRGDRARWRATAPPWISLGQTAGSGPAALTVTGNPEALTAGAHQGTIEIFDDTSGRLESFSAAITVRAPRPTVGAVSPFAVDVDSRPAALIQQIGVSDEIGGTSAAWAVRWSVEAVSAA
ncbi:MAG: hypothetical protein ACJ783_19350, partial [Myxococcales bacterium]